MTAALDAADLTYRTGAKVLVQSVSLEIAPGSVTAIVGPNGAGKSTLLRLLSGELRPSSGRIAYGGEPLERIPGWRLACMRAVLPQSSRLAFPFAVRDVVRIGLDGIGRGLDAAAKAAIIAKTMERTEIGDLGARRYQTLSGGEQQRVQFARVLAQLAAGRTIATGQALLLDEPVAGLDLKHQLALLETGAALARDGAAVVAILHDLNLASIFADRIAVMQDGRLAAFGSPDAVITDRLVREVFGVALGVGRVPDHGRPFLLPRAASGEPGGHARR